MRTINEINLAISEHRAQLYAPEVTEALATELRSKLRGLELERVEVLRARDGADPETRERNRLRAGASFGAALTAAIRERAAEGVLGEYFDSLRVPRDGSYIPLEMFRVERAAISLPDGGGVADEEYIGEVFKQSILGFMGASMSTVAAGEKNLHVLSGSNAALVAAGAVQAEAGSVALKVVEPHRVSANTSVSVEDLARSPGLESAAMMLIGEAVRDELDTVVMRRAAVPKGVYDLLTLPAAPTSLTYGNAASTFAATVDGTRAMSFSDLRAIVGIDAFASLAGTFPTNDGRSAIEYFQSMGGQIRSVPNTVIPAKSSNVQNGIVRRSPGGMPNGDLSVVTWNAVQLLRDQYTKADEGEVVLRATLLAGWSLSRLAGFAPVRFFVG